MKKSKMGALIGSALTLATGSLIVAACAEKHVHNYIGEVTAPTCTEQGYTTYTCPEDGESYIGDYTDALGHEYGEWQTKTEATCVEAKVEYRVCLHDASHVEERTVGDPDPLAHSWDDGAITQAATCEEEGILTYVCTVCGETKTEAIPATGHDYGEWQTKTEATCVEGTVEYRVCLHDSSHVEERTVGDPDLLAHVWDEGKVTKAATCEGQGVLTYTCSVCGATKTEAIPAIGHAYGSWKTKSAATCTAAEVQYRVCSHDASHIEYRTVGEPLGHDYGEWTTYTAATCTEAEVQIRVCSHDSSHVEYQTVGEPDSLAHVWDEGKVTKAATCEEEGVLTYTCTICGETRTEAIPALGHEYGEWQTETEATCTEAEVQIRVCAHDASHVEYQTVGEPLGHDYGEWTKFAEATCTEGEVQIRVCAHDASHVEYQTVGEPLGHDYGEWTKFTDATCTEAEVQMRVCAHDASHVEYQTVGEPLGHTFSGIICTTCGAVDLNAIKTRASATVSIHDPSILRAYVDVNGNVYPTAPKDIEVQDIYFLFGTHRGCAVSLDMEKWVTFSLSFYAEGTTTISTSDSEIFKSAAAWSNNSSSQIAGNLWAPDIIYNPVLEKWCVYYSMNGNAEDWMNSIFMMTSDHIAGPYVFDGFVVFSGMDKNSSGVGNDEYTKVTGEDEVAARYFTDGANWGGTYGSSCIDPVVIYDENGELWMFYGSWSGGIFLIKLDNETGLRDYTYDYGYTADDFSEDGAVWEGTGLVYDPYMGIHVAGGYYVSGEGAYVKYIDGYYYLFLTYGYLDSVGGYNMRIFRCETIDGRYVDPTGDWAVFGSFMLNYGDNMKYGVSFMQNYVWSWWSKGEVSQGHNSIYVDDDGRVFIIYHTRFNDGSETHNVRVHELVANEDGWYLAAPFRKSSTDQIVSDKTAADLAGTWGVIVHSNVDYTVRECNTDQALYLNTDGTISGLYTGTWYLNGEYITLVTNNGTFKGVVMQQYMDGVSIDGFDGVTYTFTAMNENELCLWGCLYPSGEYFIDEIETSVVLPTELIDSVVFPASGAWGAIITYTSSDESVLSATGEVRVPATDTVVTVTATIRCGTEVRTKVFQINVLSKESIADRLVVVDGEYIQDMYGGIDAGGRIASNDYINENTGLSVSFNISNYTNANTVVIKGMNTNYSIALGRIQNGNNNVTAASATASDAALALLEEMGLEATTANYTKLFLCEGSSCLVTISFNLDGSISLYRDGELMLTYAGTLKIGNRNAVLVSAVNASMISQIQLYGLSVNSSISNVVVAYAVDFDAEQYVEPEEAPKDTIAVIGTESDTVSGTYEAELGDWTLEEKVSGDFKVTYSFRVEAPSLTTDATDNNWYIKVGDWVLGANYVSLDAANGYVTLNGVTYNAQYDWETFCALYAKADVTVVIERIGDTTTVTATIKPRVFGYYGAIDYTATYKTGGDDLTVAIGGKDCLVSVYSLNVSYTGAISEGGVTIEARENITADSGISLSFWLQNSINLSDWHPLINANGYIITYGNLDSFTVETSLGGQNCYPALTTQNGVWNSMIVSDAAYFTVNVTESGIDIYKNGTLALRYSSTGKEGTYVKQFAAELLAEIEENGFYFAPEFIATDGSTVYPEIFDLTIGTALTEKEIADMYYSVID